MSELIVLSEWQKKQANSSGSKSQSKQNTTLEELGQMSTDDPMMAATLAVFAVVMQARHSPFTTKSDFARKAANEVAVCASEGFISTKIDGGSFTNKWMITQEGLEFLDEIHDVLSD